MANKLHTSNYPNVRYREHATRKARNGQPDRYYTIRYYAGGKRQEDGLGWASEGWSAAKAHGVLARIKEAIKTGIGPTSLAAMRFQGEQERQAEQAAKGADSLREITLAQFFEHYYLPRARKEKRSWMTDAQRIAKAINPALGHYPLRQLGQAHIQAFLDKLDGAPATVRQYMAIIRRAYNMAAATMVDGQPLLVGPNPCKGLSLPKVINARDRFLSFAEADAVLADARPDPDLHDAIVLSLNTGLRLGELLRLSWADVDLANGFVTVREEDKRKPGGTVPLNQEARAVFQARHRAGAQREALIFSHAKGSQLKEIISKGFARLPAVRALNLGVPAADRRRRIVFHSLRHTFASWLALAGTDIYRIKLLMRHKTIDMTMRYAHLIPDATRAAVDRLRPPTKAGECC